MDDRDAGGAATTTTSPTVGAGVGVDDDAEEGALATLSVLLEHGAAVDHQDKEGMTPLIVAAFEGHRCVSAFHRCVPSMGLGVPNWWVVTPKRGCHGLFVIRRLSIGESQSSPWLKLISGS